MRKFINFDTCLGQGKKKATQLSTTPLFQTIGRLIFFTSSLTTHSIQKKLCKLNQA